MKVHHRSVSKVSSLKLRVLSLFWPRFGIVGVKGALSQLFLPV